MAWRSLCSKPSCLGARGRWAGLSDTEEPKSSTVREAGKRLGLKRGRAAGWKDFISQGKALSRLPEESTII